MLFIEVDGDGVDEVNDGVNNIEVGDGVDEVGGVADSEYADGLFNSSTKYSEFDAHILATLITLFTIDI